MNNNSYSICCPECAEVILRSEILRYTTSGRGDAQPIKAKFCPCCGARLDKKAKKNSATTYVLHGPYEDWVECVTEDLAIAQEYVLSVHEEYLYNYFNLYFQKIIIDGDIKKAIEYAKYNAWNDTLVIDTFHNKLEDY